MIEIISLCCAVSHLTAPGCGLHYGDGRARLLCDLNGDREDVHEGLKRIALPACEALRVARVRENGLHGCSAQSAQQVLDSRAQDFQDARLLRRSQDRPCPAVREVTKMVTIAAAAAC